jgi:hypothetical protein
MKAWIISVLLIFITIELSAKPRIIKGTVYTKEGEKAKGILVTADKSRDKYYTSFDGSYQVRAKTNSKWLKFRFPDKEKTMSIEGIERDVIDYKDGSTRIISESVIKNDREKE